MMKLKIKKGDTVQLVAGSEKGKKGKVLHINSKTLKILVQGVRMQTHFEKQDGITQKEGYIDYSNVKLVEAADTAAKKKKTTQKASAKK